MSYILFDSSLHLPHRISLHSFIHSSILSFMNSSPSQSFSAFGFCAKPQNQIKMVWLEQNCIYFFLIFSQFWFVCFNFNTCFMFNHTKKGCHLWFKRNVKLKYESATRKNCLLSKSVETTKQIYEFFLFFYIILEIYSIMQFYSIICLYVFNEMLVYMTITII